MEAKLRKYRPFRNFIGRALLLAGIWPHLEDTCPFYRVVAFLAEFSLTWVTIKVFNSCLDNINSMPVFLSGMPFILSYSTLVMKVGCFVKFRKELELLNNVLGKKFEEELKEKDNHQALVGHINQYIRLTFGSSVSILFTIVFLSTTPIVFAIKYKKYRFIYLGKYPFPIEGGSMLYWALLFLEAMTGYFVTVCAIGTDNTMGLQSLRISGMLRLLSQKYSQLRSVSQLTECVRTHQMIIHCCRALQRVYGPIVLVTYLTSSIIMCILMYQGNEFKKYLTVSKAFFLLFYISTKLLQGFIYAYYGAIISDESDKCLNAVYTSNWATSGDLELMKNILTIRMQKPIVLNASNFFIITMDMFAKILNTAISYFFLLQTVTNEN